MPIQSDRYLQRIVRIGASGGEFPASMRDCSRRAAGWPRTPDRQAPQAIQLCNVRMYCARSNELRSSVACKLSDPRDFVQPVHAVPRHPSLETLTHQFDVRRTMPEQPRHHLHDVRPRQHGLDAVVRLDDATADGDRRPDTAVQDSRPAQAKPEISAGGELRLRVHCHRSNVDVRLIEAVEQHETVGTRQIEPMRHVAKGGEERRQLDGQRNASADASGL